MGKKTKSGKGRKDRFYFLAKETGFRSRAAFKLIQLNRRFNFLNTSKVLIDLCAAPGGWLQVASKEMPVASQIIGVDLVPIQPIPRVKTFIADITSEKCKQILNQELGESKADIVLHDGAPNVGTNWSIDEYSQASLCLHAFNIATMYLRRGGWFVSKVFRSRDYEPLKWVLSQFFQAVRVVKPEASRIESAEIFVVGQSYLAPARIDPKFLDPRHVFGEVDVPQSRAAVVSAFLREDKKKKKSEGYAEGDTLYHELLLSKFLEVDDPLEALAKTNKIIFDVPFVEKHPLTTASVKEDLSDIQVLGKAEIKNILKWRTKILSLLKEPSKSEDIVSTPQKEVSKMDEDLEVETEVQRLLNEEEKQKRKKLKKVRKEKRKLVERLVLKMDHEGDHIEQNDDCELFSLDTIHNLVGLEESGQLVGDTSKTGADDLARKEIDSASKSYREKLSEDYQRALKGTKRSYFEKRGEENYCSFLDESSNTRFPSGGTCRDDLYLSSGDNTDDESELAESSSFQDPVSDDSSIESQTNFSENEDITDFDSQNSAKINQNKAKLKRRLVLPPGLSLPATDPSKLNPLVVDLDHADEETKKHRKINSWFCSDDMKKLLVSDHSVENTDAVLHDTNLKNANTRCKSVKKIDEKVTKQRLDSSPQTTSVDDENSKNSAKNNKLVNKLRRLKRPLTDDERALAVRLIRSAKSRRDLLETGYHRFKFFENPAELPDWFVADEQKHLRPPLPITKEELTTTTPSMGRSIAKVKEAKARKNCRLAKRLKRIRSKAEDISDSMPETEKWQQIKQMYKKAGLLNKKKRPLHLIINTKAGSRNAGKKIPKGAKVKIVDRRLKADKRGKDRVLGKKGKSKGKNKMRKNGRVRR